MIKFSKIALVASLFVAFGAQAARPAGAPTFSASHTSNSVTINGTVYTAPTEGKAGSTVTVPAVNSSYSQVAFNSSTWTVTGGKFTAGTAATTTTTGSTTLRQELDAFVTRVEGAITTAVNDEVTYITGLVGTANTAIAGYSGTPTSVYSSTIDAAVDAVYDEVNATRSVITELKSLNVRVDTAANPNTVIIDNTRTHTINQTNSSK